MNISIEYLNILLVGAILFLPKLFMRLKIPSGITAFFLGTIFVFFFGEDQQQNQIISILSMLGITSLFLFAGLEIELDEINSKKRPILKYLLKSLIIIFLLSTALCYALDLSLQISLIVSIAVLTPSAGFILSSLKSFKMTDEQKSWIKLKAISKEIAAIIVLFFSLQINDPQSLLISTLILLFLIFSLPRIFTFFLKVIAPYAPGTEVSFLVLIAFATGVITKKIGTHYLVGAFITGIVAGQFTHFMKSDKSESILEAIGSFFIIFVPFYFFKAGMILKMNMINQEGLIIGLLLIISVIPIRLYSVDLGIKYFIEDFQDKNKTVAKALMPNLIFGLVIVSILKEQFIIKDSILFGLIIYTIIASLLPAFLFEKEQPITHDTSKVEYN